MRKTMWGAALLAAVAAHSAHAGDAGVLEPGLHFAWSFGATQAPSAPTLSVGLYPNDLGWRRMWAEAGVEEAAQLQRPAVLELSVGAATDLHLMGLPLSAQGLGINAKEGESSGVGFLKPALIVLAAGAAAALVISAAGDAADDNNPSDEPFPTGGDDDDEGGVGCVNGDCVVPCDSTVVASCNDGG